MLRLVVWVLILSVLALGASWLSGHPGKVTLYWLGYEITTSVTVVIVGLSLLLLAFVYLVILAAKIFNIPVVMKISSLRHRHDKGMESLTLAITSLAVSDINNADKYHKKARKLLGNSPLLQLIDAQISLKRGNVAASSEKLNQMLQHKPTGFIAARALSKLARQENDICAALEYAKKAHRTNPTNKENNADMLALLVKQEKWAEAENLLSNARARKVFSRKEVLHKLSLLYFIKAEKHLHDGYGQKAGILLEAAHKHDVGFIPAAVALAKYYRKIDRRGKAISVIVKSFAANPNPALTDEMLDICRVESDRKLLKNIQKMISKHPKHIESRLALARAYMAIHLWDKARSCLNEIIGDCGDGAANDEENNLVTVKGDGVQARIYSLLAELESSEGNDEKAASVWYEKATTASPNPVWSCSCCGYHSDRWLAFCPSCDGFDTICWNDGNSVTDIASSEKGSYKGIGTIAHGNKGVGGDNRDGGRSSSVVSGIVDGPYTAGSGNSVDSEITVIEGMRKYD